MDKKSLQALIREEIALYREAEDTALDIQGATLPIQALKQMGVAKPEYLPVVLDKVRKGQTLPPVDDRYLADILLKLLATDNVNAMNQIFTTIRSLSAKKA
jgi:hypothetical protein